MQKFWKSGREGGKFWGPILEIPEGNSLGGHTANPFRGGGIWIFSGTTQCESTFTAEEVSFEWL